MIRLNDEPGFLPTVSLDRPRVPFLRTSAEGGPISTALYGMSGRVAVCVSYMAPGEMGDAPGSGGRPPPGAGTRRQSIGAPERRVLSCARAGRGV